MNGALFDSCTRLLSFSWLTGPVFDKELRVSSRRRRNYLLRWAYVIAFMLLVALVWTSSVPKGSSGLFQASRMAQAGQVIVLAVVWFQFLAAQVLAIVMLSTAISDEIYHRTLGLLMTTPVGSFQIVLGKLLSKLLQVTLLLAISLPMLGAVRVFGGVPWDFVVCGLCLTLTTAVFYGSLSLFFSIFTRRAYVVIIQTVLTGGVLFAVLPLLTVLLFRHILPERVILGVLLLSNPYFGLRFAVSSIAFGPPGYPATWWLIQCGVALGCSVLLVGLATIFVRKAALRQATGRDGPLSRRRRIKTAGGASGGRIRRVIGPPVFWKERRSPLLGRLTVGRIIAGLVAAGVLVLIYVLCAREGALDDSDVQTTFIVVYTALGMLVTVILPATCITTEKESQAWPILLTTTVGNGAIIWGKLAGALRRCLPAWSLLFGHVIVFASLGYLHPVAIVQFGLLAGWITLFLCQTGLCFSTWLRRTTAAVIANLALAAGLWGVMPALLGLLALVIHDETEWLRVCLDMNPAVHIVVIADATCKGELPQYDWVQKGLRSVGAATGWMVFNFIAYAGIGLAFLSWAWSRVRRKPV